VHLHLVYHGKGISEVVNDETRKRLDDEAANPNGEIFAACARA